jgi:sortase A
MEKAKRKKTKIGIALMAFGLLLIAAAGGLFAFNAMNDKKAGETADRIIEAVEQAGEETSYEEKENGEVFAAIDGNKYIGVISIPSLSIELPVQSDYSLAKLKNSPCRYYGSVPEGTAVICAHNYQSHFGNLKYAKPGDKVYFTDVAGLTYSYEISAIEQLDGYDTERMKENTGWDMTLFTCTYSGRQRITARLTRVMNEDLK